MTLKEEIERKYDELLSITEKYDSFFDEKESSGFGGRSIALKPSVTEDYWKTRTDLELRIPQFMSILRKSISDIPVPEKKFTSIKNTDMESQNEYIVKNYENDDYESLKGFFDKIRSALEGSYDSVLYRINNVQKIEHQVRNLRGSVLSFSNLLDVFIPQEMVSIEQEVEITLRLRDLGLEKIAEEIEGINDEEDNIKKCLKMRTALEQLIVNYCQKNGITPARAFHHNLQLAIEKGMAGKEMQKTISSVYSFASKIIHKEMPADNKNTQYAIYSIFLIMGNLIGKSDK